MSDPYCELATEIAASYLNEKVESAQPIVGKGSVNQLFIVRTKGSEVVVRMNSSPRALQDYVKERWCMEQAAVRGIPSPTVLALGEQAETAFMIQTFVGGDHGEESPVDKSHIWRTLGEYAAIIHSVHVVGFGEMLSDPVQGRFEAPTHDNFDGTWSSFVRYNMDCLTDDDELIKLGVFTLEQSSEVLKLFKELSTCDFTFGLNHGDLSLKNTIVRDDGEVCLLDWGSAEVHLVPHWDLIQLLQNQIDCNHPDDAELNAYLEGYGISKEEFHAMQRELMTMLLLRAIDKLRWAIDRSPQRIPQFIERTQRVIRLVL